MSRPAGAGHVLGWSDVPLPDALLFASAWLPKELWGIHTSSARSDNGHYGAHGASARRQEGDHGGRRSAASVIATQTVSRVERSSLTALRRQWTLHAPRLVSPHSASRC